MKKIVFSFFVSSTLMISSVLAMEVPLSSEVDFFSKILKFNKTLNTKINIGLIFNPSNTKSVSTKEELLKQLKNKSFSVVAIPTNSLNDIKKYNFNILYLSKEVNQVDQISSVAKSSKLMTFSSDSSYVRSGQVSVSLINENNKIKILVNLDNSKKEGQELSSQLLKLSEIVK